MQSTGTVSGDSSIKPNSMARSVPCTDSGECEGTVNFGDHFCDPRKVECEKESPRCAHGANRVELDGRCDLEQIEDVVLTRSG